MSRSAEPRESAIAIDMAASDWLVRRNRGLTAAEAEEFGRWYRDPRHAGSFLRATALLCLAEEAQGDVATPGQVEPIARTPEMTRRRLLIGGSALAASAAGLFAIVQHGHRASSSIGEIRDFPLQDGSTALLNTASSIHIAYSKRARHIDLMAGEAWFDVAHDRARPFLVRSGRLTVRAVGTAFAVRQLAGGGETVLVTEGVVSAWVDGQEDRAVRIVAGGRATLADDRLRQDRLDAGEQDKRLAWRTGMIVLDGQTLDEAVADFNRYNRTRLVVADRTLGDRRIYGTFRARDPQALAKAVSISLDARIDQTGDRIVIRP